MSASNSTVLGLPVQSRYILFDQTGDRGKIMFGPDIFCEFPNIHENTQPQHQQGQSHVYGEAMASAFTALQNMRESRSFSVTLCRLQDETISKTSVATTINKVNEAGSIYTQEDTRDLEALLYSDDEESSTGHSPSQVTFEQDDDGDDDDTLEISSTDFAAGCSFGHKNRTGKNYAGYLSVRKKSRKEKIRHTVKQLQSIVPGGDNLDPSMILDQAIHYMKSLQMKVLELEAGRRNNSYPAKA